MVGVFKKKGGGNETNKKPFLWRALGFQDPFQDILTCYVRSFQMVHHKVYTVYIFKAWRFLVYSSMNTLCFKSIYTNCDNPVGYDIWVQSVTASVHLTVISVIKLIQYAFNSLYDLSIFGPMKKEEIHTRLFCFLHEN